MLIASLIAVFSCIQSIFGMGILVFGTPTLLWMGFEFSETLGMPLLGGRYISSALAVVAIGLFAFFKIDGQSAGLALWALFGTTNQLLGGLTLITVTLYLVIRRKNCLYTFIPMVFMLITTIAAMASNIRTFYLKDQLLLFVIGVGLLVLAAWLVIEGTLRFLQIRRDLQQSETAA